jgi:hypothetical protein
MASRKLFGFLLAFGLAGALVPGCAKQGEGDRCDLLAAGNADCDTGLVCVDATDLVDQSTDRCCPPEGEGTSDSRCARGGTVSTGGSSSAGGSSGTAGAPAAEGGAPAAEGGAPAAEPTAGAGGA